MALSDVDLTVEQGDEFLALVEASRNDRSLIPQDLKEAPAPFEKLKLSVENPLGGFLPPPTIMDGILKHDGPLDDNGRALLHAGRTIEANELLRRVLRQLEIIGAALETDAYAEDTSS